MGVAHLDTVLLDTVQIDTEICTRVSSFRHEIMIDCSSWIQNI